MSGWASPQIGRLPGHRLHLQHGPIDLVIKAEAGKAEAGKADCDLAYAAAIERFGTILGELVGELPLLRQPLTGDAPPVADGAVAQRMIAACWPHRSVFITPMAAVAGSVADEMKATMLAAAPSLRTLYVNNGGDISLHVAEGEMLKIGIVPDLARVIPEGLISISQSANVGGIATSGWHGRSFSLGIADAVTVLARCAAAADAAATIIANTVNADHPAITRRAAADLDPDSDLGNLLVTTAVGALSQDRIDTALDAGGKTARRLLDDGAVIAAALVVQSHWRIVQSKTGLLLPVP